MKTIIVSGVAAAMLVAGPAASATYSAYDQFAVAGGVITAANFAFGYATSGYAGADAITAFDIFETACAGDANLQCARAANGASVVKAAGAYDQPGTPFFDAGELNLHPGAGNQTTVVQFIVPISGLYSFSGAFTANDSSPNSVDVAAYVSGVSQIANSRGAFSFDADLTAGQKVSFALGSAGDYSFDSTGFALSVTGPDGAPGVPEPASWALMILGFGGVGAMMRRRRVATA
ncbi:PEPxxWA-CTERM sorting domain-containing protein [Phenylobacterium sp.]|uniref:PEPxxWA-CTERM sorting domain-containing protein n=1 Tax=Phenylobacterium sp. TaxID=1871053 RepID=UPI0025EB5080|nr:PEPxxWA-CTERM sorting domain-containing protein [Phenylobacterium sp.]MBX3482245.1 PEP-CTERM sorting domain-containing protein [Phenylobacterium sp.]MCW5760131.1 PEP-CTERM sorting domain-containing protein [Phenylobacterium sp.]